MAEESHQIREQISFRVPKRTADRLRNAINHLRGAPLFMKLDVYAAEALEKAVEKLEAKHNKGRPFSPPPR